MILEGFEIENWSCIKRVHVTGLPATGVVVLHGPNRTGKSSIVHALRSCLMDYASTSAALKSCYTRGSGEKPVVSVTYRAGGTSYRITKQFGTSKSKLESKTAEGVWTIETTSASEAHRRVCGHAGGEDSTKGLHQLLWLTQAEFRLPDVKKFDPAIQSQLRGILGVLQTPLDDRFIERVKKRWATWFSGQRKAGKIKAGCKLAENLEKLEAGRAELKETEGKFIEVENLLRQSSELELRKLDLDQQLRTQAADRQRLREEHQRSQARIAERRSAEARQQAAGDKLAALLDEQQRWAETERRSREDQIALEPARLKAEAATLHVKAVEESLSLRRKHLAEQRNVRRELQVHADRIAIELRAQALAEKLGAAQRDQAQVEEIAREIARLEEYFASHPSPDEKSLAALKANRERASRLRAEHEAVSMNLTLVPKGGAAPAKLAIDGEGNRELVGADKPVHCTVRRKASLLIGDWGSIELTRGTGSGDLDQIEEELRKCEKEFSDGVAPLGISATDPCALDVLMERASEYRIRSPELERQRRELKRRAPKGSEPLHALVIELQTKLGDIRAVLPPEREQILAVSEEIEKSAAYFRTQLDLKDTEIKSLEADLELAEGSLALDRTRETAAKEELATCRAKANSSREELERLPSEAECTERLRTAEREVQETRAQLALTELTEEERTIDERLEAAEQAVKALEEQSRENTRKYDVIKGRLLESEGLHSVRSACAARVDELERLTQLETLEKDAVDRLYALFEECREKQLGALMGPIHDRVLNWMRVLGIGDYREMRFNDAFLPDKLMTRDGASEFAIHEESTGAQEQIGMLVRLALGSTLTSAGQPAIAILDDPLTHCDIGRLSKMRAILRRAAEGESTLTPPAGPLQIIILTCHPEWFRDEKATVIDLEDPGVMSRWPV